MMASHLPKLSSTSGKKLAQSSYLDNEMRIVLIGKTGTGKSRAGNMILGKQEFHFAAQAGSVTNRCWSGRTTRFEQTLLVTDTPGLWDTNKQNDEVIKEIQKCIMLSAPGPHAIILIVAAGRFTEEEITTVQEFQKYFGEAMIRYLIVLFTKTDDLEEQNQTIQDYLKTAPKDLQELLVNSNNRYIGFNNKLSHKQGEQQVKQLLDIIHLMVRQNGGSFYTSEMFQEAEAAMQRRVEQIRREEEEKRNQEMKELERKFQERVEEMNQKYRAELGSLTEAIKQLQSEKQEKSEEAAELLQMINSLKMDNQSEKATEADQPARNFQDRKNFFEKKQSQPQVLECKQPISNPRPTVTSPPPQKPSRANRPSDKSQARPEDVRAAIMKDSVQFQLYRQRLEETLQERQRQQRKLEAEREREEIEYNIWLREKAREEVKMENRSICSLS